MPYKVSIRIYPIFFQKSAVQFLGIDVFRCIHLKHGSLNGGILIFKYLISDLILCCIPDSAKMRCADLLFQRSSFPVWSPIQLFTVFDQFQNSFLFLIILADCADQISILIHQRIAVVSHLSIRINRCIVNHKTDWSLFRCLNSITEQAIFTGISQSLLSSVLYIAFRCSQFCQFIGTGRQFCRNCEIAVHNFPLRILEQRRSKRTVNCPILFAGYRFVIPDITISILFPAIFQKQLIFSLIQCGFHSIRSPLLQHGPLHHLFRSQKRSIRCHEVCIRLYQPDIGLCPVIGNISGFQRYISSYNDV